MRRFHHISFKHAWDGLVYIFESQPNMRVHSLATILVLVAGFYFHITQTEWLILLFTIILVLITEMVNTSLESMTDLITETYHKQAKITKDVSAAMVLIAAIASVAVGVTIFLPYLQQFLEIRSIRN